MGNGQFGVGNGQSQAICNGQIAIGNGQCKINTVQLAISEKTRRVEMILKLR
jgi:hypothetical protein